MVKTKSPLQLINDATFQSEVDKLPASIFVPELEQHRLNIHQFIREPDMAPSENLLQKLTGKKYDDSITNIDRCDTGTKKYWQIYYLGGITGINK